MIRKVKSMSTALTNGIVLRWTFLTMLGLAAGIVTALLLDRPIEAVVGMMLVTPILTLLAGAVLGTTQWFQLRSLLGRTRLWVLATSVGLGVGLALGVVTLEGIGRFFTGARPRLIQLTVFWRAASFVLLGIVTGLSVGISQWIAVLRRRIAWRKWIATSAVSLGLAFSISSLIVDGMIGGIATPLGVMIFVLVAGLIFGAGTARPILRAA